MSKAKIELCKIKSQQMIAKDIYELTLISSYISRTAGPGEFVTLFSGKEVFFRRPFSLCAVHEDSFIVIYKKIGKGTAYLSGLKSGDTIEVNGPLGRGFPMCTGKDIYIVGGGIGIPPLYFIATELYRSNTVYSYLGFKSKDESYYTDRFSLISQDTHVASDDGSMGEKGFITDILAKQATFSDNAVIYACGPHGMLRSIRDLSQHFRVETYISAEEIMGCGIGICLGCAVPSGDSYLHVCTDGPVFNIKDIDIA
ncbi:dihydroorotate dehydrogenase electron transfer subunit [Spirochaetota bacterium]